MFHNIRNIFEKKYIRKNIPKILIGDYITIEIESSDELKKRTQLFSGIVISIKNKGICSSIVVKKYSSGINIEQIFFINSKNIKNIIVNNHNKINKAKLFFLKNKIFNKFIKIKKKY